jgi:hypothetical protein
MSAAIGFLPASMDFLHGHDHLDHLTWNIGFLDVLRAGVLYPRWLPDINQGDGGPTFIFYGPLFSYVTALFSWKLGIIQGLTMASFLFWWGSGAAMYLCARQWLPRPASLAAALVYLFLPYHVYDLYMRAALAEFAQFFWLPLIVLWLAKLRRGGVLSVIALAFCIAGAILTHVITAVVVFYLLAVVSLIALFRSRSMCLKIIIAMAWGMALSSVYLLPALWERSFINPGLFLADNGDYTRNFLFSPADTEIKKSALLWALVQAGLLAPLLLVCGLPKPDKNGDSADVERLSTLRRHWLALGILALFMMLPISVLIWKLPGLRYLQFPWRWLLVGSFAASFLVGLQCRLLRHIRPIWRVALLVFLIANLCLTARLWSFRMMNALAHNHDYSELLQKARYYRDMNSPPKWISRAEERFRSRRGQALKAPVTIVQGVSDAKILEWAPSRRQVALEAQTETLVRLRTFYYPGWNCQLDGNPAPIEISSEGQIVVSVPAGRHLMSCSFSNTPVRTVGSITSLVAFFASLLAVVISRRRSRAIEPLSH